MSLFSSILKINPKLDDAGLRSMEKTLNGRFMKVAKGFGKGIVSVLKGGGIAAAGLALLDKVLNPLKDAQEAIDKQLRSADDISTNANQFGTTSGKLQKLVTLGESGGLDQDQLFMLLNKFQNSVAEAEAKPGEPSSVRSFVGMKDTADSFFLFLQSLQKMDKNQQLLVQQQVFGEKQILKMADFLQTDFPRRYIELGLNKISTAMLTETTDKGANLNDKKDIGMARLNLEDRIAKSKSITDSTVAAMVKSEAIARQREQAQVAQFEKLAAIDNTVQKMMILLDKGIAMLGDLITKALPAITMLTTNFGKLLGSKILRGYLTGKDK